MTDKELITQMLTREVNNILGNINPVFKMFSGNITSAIISFIEPYLTAFTDPDTNHVNTKAAEAYLKQETSEKIEAFMKKFSKEMENPNV